MWDTVSLSSCVFCWANIMCICLCYCECECVVSSRCWQLLIIHRQLEEVITAPVTHTDTDTHAILVRTHSEIMNSADPNPDVNPNLINPFQNVITFSFSRIIWQNFTCIKKCLFYFSPQMSLFLYKCPKCPRFQEISLSYPKYPHFSKPHFRKKVSSLLKMTMPFKYLLTKNCLHFPKWPYLK